MSGLYPRGRPQRMTLVGQLKHVPRLHVQAVSRGRAQDGGVVPGEFGNRLGQFLEPPVVAEPSVVNGGIGTEVHLELAFQTALLRAFGDRSATNGGSFLRER